ncbi:MAG: O-methyltransferase [Prevotellaceae bacterium]|jgi:predicted O-methyltransferase YrrM|nr:O-methyltransferase [Prevotellaceae bacterium]
MQNLNDYILSHLEPEPEYLQALARKTHVRLVNPRMVSGHLQGRFLKMLTRMINPKNALEIGSFTGYSALCIAEGLAENAHLHTIEIDDELKDFIHENFKNSPFEQKITLHIGNALKIVETLPEIFDLVFIDADKRQYWEYFEAVLPKVRKGGFIIVDNTLWNGKILQPVQHSDRHTQSILDFNNLISNDKRIEQILVPIRDGLTLIMKK